MNPTEIERPRSYPDGRPYDEQPRGSKTSTIRLTTRWWPAASSPNSWCLPAAPLWPVLDRLGKCVSTVPLPEKRLVPAADVQPGGVVEFRYPTEADPCLLVRMLDGSLVAYSQKCTHLSCARHSRCGKRADSLSLPQR